MNFELETQSLNFLYCLHPKPPKGKKKKKRDSSVIYRKGVRRWRRAGLTLERFAYKKCEI